MATIEFRHDVPNVVWSRDAVMDEDAPNQGEIECRAVFMVATLLTCNLGHPPYKVAVVRDLIHAINLEAEVIAIEGSILDPVAID
jgi:hypothetical protein